MAGKTGADQNLGVLQGSRAQKSALENYFLSSGVVLFAEPSPLMDDLKLRMPSPSPLPSSPSFFGPKINRAITKMTASSGKPSFPPNIKSFRCPVRLRLRKGIAGFCPDSRLSSGARQSDRPVTTRRRSNSDQLITKNKVFNCLVVSMVPCCHAGLAKRAISMI